MKKQWKKLRHLRAGEIGRGSLLKFPAKYPFEEKVVMMLCTTQGDSDFPISLITITGYKAGINPVQCLPKECLINGSGYLDIEWIINNWNKWVYSDCDVNDVWARTESLSVDEI